MVVMDIVNPKLGVFHSKKLALPHPTLARVWFLYLRKSHSAVVELIYKTYLGNKSIN